MYSTRSRGVFKGWERSGGKAPDDRSYITVEPGQTAESYTAGLRQKYITAFVLAGAYVILYAAAWCVVAWVRKKKARAV